MLSRKADLIALQETWMLESEIPELGSVNSDYSYCGKSAVDISSGILRGRKYGGVALLWRTSKFNHVSVIKCKSDRIIAIRACLPGHSMLFFSVYMPTDSS